MLRLGPKEADALLTSDPPELAVIAAWVTNDRHGAVALDLAQRAFRRAESIADAPLREKTWWSILTVLHPLIVEKVRRLAMIDINQFPKNPAVEQWAADLRANGEARLLVCVLRLRGIVARPADEARILACMDAPQIELWTERALTATRIDEVFVEP